MAKLIGEFSKEEQREFYMRDEKRRKIREALTELNPKKILRIFGYKIIIIAE